jgi:maleylpyruvate isomerase
LCEGWTRGHVLTHIARNADGIADTLAGALRGEIVDRYPDGWDARNAAIAAGADRPFAELAADVRDSGSRLGQAFAAIAAADGWELPTEHGDPAQEWAFRRWREVEVHRVDLAAGYTPDQWPARLVTALLPEAVGALGPRIEGAVRVTITADGSVAPELVDRSWAFGDGDAVEVRGPDWAVLTWLTGRPAAGAHALSATPPLREWR